jgi:hypothetical protein
LLVTIRAGFGTIRQLTFGHSGKTIQNARVEALHPSTIIITGTGTFTPMPGATEVAFVVRRTTPGQGVIVPVIVEDGCGPWETFVGGGNGAF